MAGSKSSSCSKVPLIAVVSLIIAIAGANCDIIVRNNAQHVYFQIVVITSPVQLELDPGTAISIPIPPPVSTSTVPVVPEVVYVERYTTSPNASANIAGVKEFFATLWMYSNATVTFFEVDSPMNSTGGRVGFSPGFSVDYI
ncbi:unnamed protein product [Calypogeia fissa]